MRATESGYINQSLIEATYLYCYKRLQNAHDSEELTQEILFEAVKALHGGKSIERFYSWYWAMAKNRFNLFLRMTVRSRLAGGGAFRTEGHGKKASVRCKN